jgi:hypothetical protein
MIYLLRYKGLAYNWEILNPRVEMGAEATGNLREMLVA